MLNIDSPQDTVNFLIWRDKFGKTYSYADDCVERSGAKSSCSCPKSLAAGTIDNNIRRLRSISRDGGRGSLWKFYKTNIVN